MPGKEFYICVKGSQTEIDPVEVEEGKQPNIGREATAIAIVPTWKLNYAARNQSFYPTYSLSHGSASHVTIPHGRLPPFLA
jgi:hypothetical protein